METPNRKMVMAILPGATEPTEVDPAEYVFVKHGENQYAFPKTGVKALEPKFAAGSLSKLQARSDIAEHLRRRTHGNIFGE